MFRAAITVDAHHPRAADVASYFAALARRLDERPEALRVTVEAPPGVSFDMDVAGRLVVRVAGQRPAVCDLRRRWIADHDVPLDLEGRTVFTIRPVDANRFRVRETFFSLLRRRWKRLFHTPRDKHLEIG